MFHRIYKSARIVCIHRYYYIDDIFYIFCNVGVFALPIEFTVLISIHTTFLAFLAVLAVCPFYVLLVDLFHLLIHESICSSWSLWVVSPKLIGSVPSTILYQLLAVYIHSLQGAIKLTETLREWRS